MTLWNGTQSSPRLSKIFSTSSSLTLAHDSPGSKLTFSLLCFFLFSSLFLLHVLHLLLHLPLSFHLLLLLLLLALVVVIAVHLLVLPILRPFLLITNWPTYSHRCFQNTTESEQPLSQGKTYIYSWCQ